MYFRIVSTHKFKSDKILISENQIENSLGRVSTRGFVISGFFRTSYSAYKKNSMQRCWAWSTKLQFNFFDILSPAARLASDFGSKLHFLCVTFWNFSFPGLFGLCCWNNGVFYYGHAIGRFLIKLFASFPTCFKGYSIVAIQWQIYNLLLFLWVIRRIFEVNIFLNFSFWYLLI